MNFIDYKAMMSALEAGTATPAQQHLAFAHIQAIKRQHNADLRDAERDARDSYHEGRAAAAADQRGEPYGTY